jgi:hypothetical protein
MRRIGSVFIAAKQFRSVAGNTLPRRVFSAAVVRPAAADAPPVENPKPHQYPIQKVENSSKPITILDGKDATYYFNQITEKYSIPVSGSPLVINLCAA